MTAMLTVKDIALPALRAGIFGIAFGMAAAPMTAMAEVAVVTPQSSAALGVDELAKTMQMERVIDVMREEGLAYAETLEADMFPGRGGATWRATVEKIYDPEPMRAEFLAAMRDALADEDGLDAMMGFMSSELGQRVIVSELSARSAMMDPDLEEAARVAWLEIENADDRRAKQIEEFIQVNDLMDSNVTGGMNSNLAFYRGLMSTMPPDTAMPEEDVLAMVAGQESEIRAETADWLYAYLALAYQPLSDDEFAQYIDFSKSAAGERLNAALFTAFAGMFDRVSYQLGHEAGLLMRGENI